MANQTYTTESDFSHAIAEWMNGNDYEACRLLSQIQTEHAQNLLNLIRKPHITVLAQLPWITKGTQDLQSGAEFDPKFIVRNIGFKPKDLQNRAYADIHDFYDPANPPDFYISQMVEWHLTPPNIQELPCPIFGQTSDYDLHIQFLHPWLKMFDELIVNGPDEQEEVSRLSGVSVTTYPKTFSIPDTLPPLPASGCRNIDFFMSGTIFHPYHNDKARLVNRILSIPDFNPLFYDGFLVADAYYELLSCSRMALTFVRHADAMPTRGLESLAMGCALIVQKQSVLNQYLGEEEGVVTYDYEKDDLQDVMQRVKREWPLFEQRARRGAEIVRREFSSSKVASQYLRFLTVLAAKPRRSRHSGTIKQLDQKRPVITKGWGYPYDTYKEMQRLNAQRWINRLSSAPRSSELNDLAREYLLDFCTWGYLQPITLNQDCYDYTILSNCLELYRIGIRQFPRALALRFNMIRAAVHFGNPCEVDEALELLQATLAISPDDWEITPMDDVMPWDFFSQMFNYRSYLDTVTAILRGDSIPDTTLVNLIRSSLFHYQGHYSNNVEHLQSAVRLDPEFPFYRLRLAATLIKRNNDDDITRGVAHLELLAEDSMLHVEAFRLMEMAEVTHGCRSDQMTRLRERFRHIDASFHTQKYQVENWGNPHLQKSKRAGFAPLSSLQTATRKEAQPLHAAPGRPLNILYITLEFSNWRAAKGWTYPSNIGVEEGFAAHGAEFLTIPMIHGISSELPASWLFHAKRLCEGKEFDQVWIELVHGNPGEEVLEWLVTLAPVRVGILPESLSYDYEDYMLHPNLSKRRLEVEARLRYMTHAVAVDEKDAEDLNRRGIVNTMWRPETVPSWCLPDFPNNMPRDKAVFYGTLYGARKRWLMHPALSGLFEMRCSAEAGTTIPHAFTSVGSAALMALNKGRAADREFLNAYLDSLRGIRRTSFANWIRLASEAPIIVNLPSTTKVQSGRVVEAMAAGSPVLTWKLPDRPRANNLFKDGEEYLLFPHDEPEALAEKIRYLGQHPEIARAMAGKALETVRTRHTLELRVGQILQWIKTGKEPDYLTDTDVQHHKSVSLPSGDQLDSTVRRFFDMAGYHGYEPRLTPRTDTAASKDEIERELVRFGTLLEQRNLNAAQKLLEELCQREPKLTPRLAQFYFVIGDTEKAEEFLLQSLSANQYDADAYIKLAQLARKAGNHESCGAHVEIALSLGPMPGEVISLIEEHRQMKAETANDAI